MDDLGAGTDDILTLRQRHPREPAADEDGNTGIPAREALNRRYGSVLLTGGATLILITNMTMLVIPERITRLLPLIETITVIVSVLGLGLCGVLCGLSEKLTRYNRTLMRQQLQAQAESLDMQVGINASIIHIRSVLPRALDAAHWRGYAAAEREHAALANNDPSRRRFGVVPRPDQPPNQG